MRKKKYLFPIIVGIISLVFFLIGGKLLHFSSNESTPQSSPKPSEPSMHIFGEVFVGSGSCDPKVKRGVAAFSGKIIFMKKQDVTNLVKTIDSMRLKNGLTDSYEEHLDIGMRKIKYSSLFALSKNGQYSAEIPYGEYIVTPDITTYLNQEIVLETDKKEKKEDFRFFECR